MKTKIVKIGNSRGIRIPKSLIEESGLHNEVELKVEDDIIIIKPLAKYRESWDAAFQKMAKNSDDILLDAETIFTQNNWDEEEWEW